MVAASALLLKVGRPTISPIIIIVSKAGGLMVYSLAAASAAGWSTKAWSQGIAYLVHVANIKGLGPKMIASGPEYLRRHLEARGSPVASPPGRGQLPRLQIGWRVLRMAPPRPQLRPTMRQLSSEVKPIAC
jgi:hypothetical protein